MARLNRAIWWDLRHGWTVFIRFAQIEEPLSELLSLPEGPVDAVGGMFPILHKSGSPNAVRALFPLHLVSKLSRIRHHEAALERAISHANNRRECCFEAQFFGSFSGHTGSLSILHDGLS